MLGPDLVRARRRGEKLELQKFPPEERARACSIASDLLEIARSSLGSSQDEVVEAWNAIDREAREEKLWAGLKKLLMDACEFGSPSIADPVSLRRALFERASALRASDEIWDRELVVSQVATQQELSPEALEESLFSDLKGAARLTRVPAFDPEVLVERYELAQVQGVLLRAVRLSVVVRSSRPEGYRELFHKLKFRQLLYKLERLPDQRYRIEIDGPFSVLEAVTKYGLQLALLVPALLSCDEVELEADIRWGKERKPLQFRNTLKRRELKSEDAPSLRPELEGLIEAWDKRPSAWKLAPAEELLDVPGVGLCVPDLSFTRPNHPPVHLELLGYWSREAVWKRIEWAEANPDQRILFAVSSRLRVSEEVLPETANAALYVFKGTLSPRAILEKLERISGS